ncbi:MAG TPA: hypothetical protein VLJ57_14440 [Burkholderiaceae bacterium]|nr:hypothetical protein [Burkholderiaceae bacterium]
MNIATYLSPLAHTASPRPLLAGAAESILCLLGLCLLSVPMMVIWLVGGLRAAR